MPGVPETYLGFAIVGGSFIVGRWLARPSRLSFPLLALVLAVVFGLAWWAGGHDAVRQAARFVLACVVPPGAFGSWYEWSRLSGVESFPESHGRLRRGRE